MKIQTSYFYGIRFFNPSIIPVSTAIWDPKWYHDNMDQGHIFKDSNGVLIGLRMEELSPLGIENCCPCEDKIPSSPCKFLSEYRKKLDSINFEEFKKSMNDLTEFYKRTEDIDGDITVALIVHESPDNPCSERSVLQSWLKDNGEDGTEFVISKMG